MSVTKKADNIIISSPLFCFKTQLFFLIISYFSCSVIIVTLDSVVPEYMCMMYCIYAKFTIKYISILYSCLYLQGTVFQTTDDWTVRYKYKQHINIFINVHLV